MSNRIVEGILEDVEDAYGIPSLLSVFILLLSCLSLIRGLCYLEFHFIFIGIVPFLVFIRLWYTILESSWIKEVK